MHANKGAVGRVGDIEDIVLSFFAIDIVPDLIDERVIIELHGEQWIDAVDGVVGGGDVGDGDVADDDGEDEADDGREDLAAVGAGLSLLQVEVLQDQRLDLVA